MQNRVFTIADVDAAIAAENDRHKAAIVALETTRRTLIDLLGGTNKFPSNHDRRILFDPREYGGKKKLLLRLIAAEKNGIPTSEVVAAASRAGLDDAKVENVVPQLSIFKSDGLLTLSGSDWIITDNGREYLAPKS
jgi:hypothetical protein